MKPLQPIITATMFSHHKYHAATASGVPVKPIWHFTLSLGTHSLTVAGPTDRPTDDCILLGLTRRSLVRRLVRATRRRILEMRPPSLPLFLAAAHLGKSPLTLLRNFRLLPSFQPQARPSSFFRLFSSHILGWN